MSAAVCRALERVVVDIGQLSQADRRALDREVRRGKLQKWRGRWCPVPGAPWGIGPLKTCYGPAEPVRKQLIVL
jgi:hypothetical protein